MKYRFVRLFCMKIIEWVITYCDSTCWFIGVVGVKKEWVEKNVFLFWNSESKTIFKNIMLQLNEEVRANAPIASSRWYLFSPSRESLAKLLSCCYKQKFFHRQTNLENIQELHTFKNIFVRFNLKLNWSSISE